MATYAYLVDPENQFITKSGTINVGGWLRVYDAATDDAVVTYKDFNGTENTEQIILDSNGRAVVIADSERAYRLEVYDRYGTLQWTTTPLWCMASGGGVNVHRTEVISTDGSIDIDKVTVGSTTTFDIGLAPSDSDEFLEWVKCADEDVANGIVYPTFVDGTMETQPNQGLHVGKDRFYHITASFRVYPSGTGINYESLTTELKFNDGETTSLLIRRTYDIDNSLHDSVMCEFSYDFKAPADGYLFFQLDNVAVFHDVAVVMQVHRIYSGINAVPDTCATKQWVQETFDYNLSGKIGYSALEYNPTGEISGISGSAIATTDPARVSAIASSYAESAVSSISAWSGYFSSISGKADQSAFEQCCDEVHSALEEVTNNISSISSTVSGLTGQYIEQSASGMFQPSGHYVSADNMSAYVPFSGLEGDGSKITGISGSAIKGHEYTGINPVIVDNVEDTIAVDHRTLAVDETMTAYNSGSSAVIGVNVEGLNLSSKLDASASSLFYGTSNPSGFVDSSYVASAVSGKLDTTAFSTVSGNFLTSHQSLAGYATELYVDSAVSGKLDVTASSQFLTSLPDDLATTGDVASAVSGKLDNSASGEWYPMTGNPSGFLTAHQSLAGYATEQYVDSAVSSKLDATAYDSAQFVQTSSMSSYALSSDVSGVIDTVSSNSAAWISGGVEESAVSAIASSYAESAASGKLDSSAQVITSTASASIGMGYDPVIKAFNGSAVSAYRAGAADTAIRYLISGSARYISALDTGLSNLSGQMSSKLDESATSDFYSTSNPSGFITGVDLTPYQTTAGMTAYQEVSGMTAYQPVGTYIYESALGWAEV